MFPRRISAFCGVLAMSALFAPMGAEAQDYPAQPIRLVVAYPAGGTADAVGRVVSEALTKSTDATIVVDNQGGASGIIGSGQVARAEPNGYTLLIGANSIFSVMPHLRELDFDPNADLVPIAKIADSTRLLAVNPSVPAETLAEFIAYAKANPGALNYASSGNGSTPQILTEIFKSEAEVDIRHIPYGGAGPAMNGLLSGTVQMMIDTVVIPQAEGGALRGLAVFGNSRIPGLPDVPTMAEAGFAGVRSAGWTGLFAPKDTPPEIMGKLEGALKQLYDDPKFVERLASVGVVPDYQPSATLAGNIAADFQYFGGVIKAAGITAE